MGKGGYIGGSSITGWGAYSYKLSRSPKRGRKPKAKPIPLHSPADRLKMRQTQAAARKVKDKADAAEALRKADQMRITEAQRRKIRSQGRMAKVVVVVRPRLR